MECYSGASHQLNAVMQTSHSLLAMLANIVMVIANHLAIHACNKIMIHLFLQADAAEDALKAWIENNEKIRHKYKLLLFFSNTKARLLHSHIYQLTDNIQIIMQDISIIFSNDEKSRSLQYQYVKVDDISVSYIILIIIMKVLMFKIICVAEKCMSLHSKQHHACH